jgi:hypothetical protein
MTKKWLSKEKNSHQLWMKVWQIAFDSQKYEKYALQAQNNIGWGEIGTFSYWIIRYEYKRIYKKLFGVLIWYWISRIIGLSSIGLNEMYCSAIYWKLLIQYECIGAIYWKLLKQYECIGAIYWKLLIQYECVGAIYWKLLIQYECIGAIKYQCIIVYY